MLGGCQVGAQAAFEIDRYYARSAFSTASGSSAATFSKARAGPSGRRRPCSQFRSVATLTPIMRANSDCDRCRLCRTALISTGPISKTREGVLLPRLMSPASLVLVTNSLKSSSFTSTPLGSASTVFSPAEDSDRPDHSCAAVYPLSRRVRRGGLRSPCRETWSRTHITGDRPPRPPPRPGSGVRFLAADVLAHDVAVAPPSCPLVVSKSKSPLRRRSSRTAPRAASRGRSSAPPPPGRWSAICGRRPASGSRRRGPEGVASPVTPAALQRRVAHGATSPRP